MKLMALRINPEFLALLKHGLTYISADFISKSLLFIGIPVFTRLLSPDEYGVLSIYTVYINIFTVMAGLGLRGAVSRYFFEERIDFYKFLGVNVTLVTYWSLGLCVIVLVFNGLFLSFFRIPFNVLLLGMIVFSSAPIPELYQSYLQASQQSKSVAKLYLFRDIVFLILSFVLTYCIKVDRYYGKIIAQVVVWCFFLIYVLRELKPYIKFGLIRSHSAYSLTFSIPILLHLLTQYVLIGFDQIVINQVLGAVETGLYSFAYKVGMIQNVISMGLLRAWTPMFYHKMKNSEFGDIEKYNIKYFRIIVYIACLLILFSREIVLIMADSSYHGAVDVVPVIIASYVFFYIYTIYVNYAFFYKKTKNIAIFTLISGLINVGLNYKLIPLFGYRAAAATTLISYISLVLFHYINVRFVIRCGNYVRIGFFIPHVFQMLILIPVLSFLHELFGSYFLILVVKVVISTIMSINVFRIVRK